MSPNPQPEILNPSSPTADSQPAAQLAALLTGAGIHPLTETGWIRITGEDRVRWLNGMATNTIQDLEPGQGNYNFFLSAQGRIQGDATIFADPDSEALLLETSAAHLPSLIAHLDRFIIMDDVELADISATRAGLLITGPQAHALLTQLDLPAEGLATLQMKSAPWHGGEVTIIHAHSPRIPRFELWSDPATIAKLSEALTTAGAIAADAQTLETLRILERIPRYGTDIRNTETAKELPQETAYQGSQSRALHFSKGCYLGQEIVERINSRGNVHRTFTAFQLEGTLPPAGTTLEVEGKQVGELTSVATIPIPTPTTNEPTQQALGYIRREALERHQISHQPITYPGGTAIPIPSPKPIY
jgi:folate-binding protein YgfZ